jgi:hypothetical protein
MRQRTVGPSQYSVEPGFSAAASFDVCATANLTFGLRHGIRIGGTGNLVLIIRYFNPSRPTFTMSGQSRRPLPALTAW